MKEAHLAETQNQYFNYIMLSITLHKLLAYTGTYIFENEVGVSKKAVQQNNKRMR
jgi:hypothetical protein